MPGKNLDSAKNFMLQHHLKDRGITDAKVLNAFHTVPRNEFVSPEWADASYNDSPLPIGYGQTISQPFIVAFMVDALKISPENSILEIGTGCGYQTAILSLLGKSVYSIEIVKQLADEAELRLKNLNFLNTDIRHGDGSHGWTESAPFDRIIVSAAARKTPPDLVKQLKPGGRLVIPVGRTVWNQTIRIIDKSATGNISETYSLGVRFVPLISNDPL